MKEILPISMIYDIVVASESLYKQLTNEPQDAESIRELAEGIDAIASELRKVVILLEIDNTK